MVYQRQTMRSLGLTYTHGLPQGLSSKDFHLRGREHRRLGFNPWVGKIPWRRAWQPTPVSLPGQRILALSRGQRSLVGYSPWGGKESDTTEASWHTCTPFSEGSPPNRAGPGLG